MLKDTFVELEPGKPTWHMSPPLAQSVVAVLFIQILSLASLRLRLGNAAVTNPVTTVCTATAERPVTQERDWEMADKHYIPVFRAV